MATLPPEPAGSNPTDVCSAQQNSGGHPSAGSCLIPSFADAVTLLSSQYSCLVLDSHRRHVILPPVHLHKKRTGIQEELNSELLKYSGSLKGVPLAYDNIKIIGKYGDIYDDQGFIHLNIEASFVIFKPKKDSKLVGVINKIGTNHVGCLVHGCFNACVVKPSQLTSEQWRDCGLCVGETLEFDVFQLDSDVAGVLLIRGRLEKSRVRELLAQAEEDKASVIHPAEPAMEPESTEDTSDGPKPKKKKKKEKRDTSEDAGDDSNLPQTCDNHGSDVDKTEVDFNSRSLHKKKKKKDKREKQDTSEESVGDGSLPQTSDMHEPDVEMESSRSKPDKKKKNRDKCEKQITSEESAENGGLSQSNENHEADQDRNDVDLNSNTLQKKKKKKKRDKEQSSGEVLPSDPPASDSSGYLSDKTSRKRQADEIEDDSETPVSRKKKRASYGL